MLQASRALCAYPLQYPGWSDALRLLLVAPLLEEWIVRAGLQEWLMRRARPLPAAVLLLAPALGFALLHLGAGWRQALAVLAPALAIGLLYLARRDWRLCALAHALFNGAALAVCAGPSVL